MRRILELISLAALLTLLGITANALYGPHRIPDKIPTLFGSNGQPDAWGSSVMLLPLPILAIFLYAGITLVSRFPSAFNYPVRVTAQNRARLQSIALHMVASLKAETLVLFALLQYFTIDAARTARLGLPPGLMFTAIALIFLTMAAHIVAMRRAA
jgi:uncharacterized membrane protein